MHMAVKTNLATKPYTNRRLLSLILGLIILVCAAMSNLFVEKLAVAKVNAQTLQAETTTQQQHIAELQKRIPPPVTPDQLSSRERELLMAASALIERRVFPWSKLLQDLEMNLGKDVRLTRINVALEDISKVDLLRPGTAPMEISMVVIGKQLDNVLDMMRSLQASGRFTQFRPRKQSLVEGTQEVEYEVEMTYTLK
jgi:hypothetical protein